MPYAFMECQRWLLSSAQVYHRASASCCTPQYIALRLHVPHVVREDMLHR
jgi:hypothetical protein